MSFNKEIFREYFRKEISKNALLLKIGEGINDFENELELALQKAIKEKDSEMLEYLIYSIFITPDKINLYKYVYLLNELIICDWHEQHENIAMLLQRIGDFSSAKYLKDAISLKPKYLNWDDNYAFEVKCIWALGSIKTEEVKLMLKEISLNPNKILASTATQIT